MGQMANRIFAMTGRGCRSPLMAGIGHKRSLAEASRNVRFPIRKLTFESTAAAHNELFVGYVGFPAKYVCLSLNSRRNQVGRS
jgi:hypothetical protein